MGLRQAQSLLRMSGKVPYIVRRPNLSGLGALLGAALLRLRLVGRRNHLDHLDGAAGALDRLARAGGDAGDAEGELRREAALAEDADAVLAAARQAGGAERGLVD